MSALLIGGFVLLNLAISFFNAYVVGQSWPETKAVGGLPRFMAWMGAIMSACGFTWCYLVILAVLAKQFNWLNEEAVEAMFSLGYLTIILPVLGSGLAITAASWGRLVRERTFKNAGFTAWNTFAQAYNTYNAIRAVPDAFSSVGGFFRSRDSNGNNGPAIIVILLVVLAVVGGVLTTTIIIRRTASAHAKGMRRKRPRSLRTRAA